MFRFLKTLRGILGFALVVLCLTVYVFYTYTRTEKKFNIYFSDLKPFKFSKGQSNLSFVNSAKEMFNTTRTEKKVNTNLSDLKPHDFSKEQSDLSFVYSAEEMFETILRIRQKNCQERLQTAIGSDDTIYCRNIQLCNTYSTKRPDLPTGCEHRLPRALIIGVFKAGTRELLDFLAMHPRIVIKRREISFFTHKWKRGFDWYRDFMPRSMENQIGMEKSPNYFSSSETPERIQLMDPGIKLILMIREPIDRVISHLTYMEEDFAKHVNLSQNLSEISWVDVFGERFKFSFYDEPFEQYLKYFNRSQIHIVDSVRLKVDPYSVLYDVESFLGLPHIVQKDDFVFNKDKGFYCLKDPGTDVSMCFGNDRGRPKESTINWDKVIPELRRVFKPHNERFFQLSGTKFEWNY